MPQVLNKCHFPGDSLGGEMSYKNVNNGYYNNDPIIVRYQDPGTALGSVYS